MYMNSAVIILWSIIKQLSQKHNNESNKSSRRVHMDLRRAERHIILEDRISGRWGRVYEKILWTREGNRKAKTTYLLLYRGKPSRKIATSLCLPFSKEKFNEIKYFCR